MGELTDNEMPVFPERRYGCVFPRNVSTEMLLFFLSFSEFYEVLKGRVAKYFKDNNIVSAKSSCARHVISM